MKENLSFAFTFRLSKACIIISYCPICNLSYDFMYFKMCGLSRARKEYIYIYIYNEG